MQDSDEKKNQNYLSCILCFLYLIDEIKRIKFIRSYFYLYDLILKFIKI